LDIILEWPGITQEEYMPQETFTHTIAMDFDVTTLAQSTWWKNLEEIKLKLAIANATIQSNLRVTWQGNAATEFFAVYEPMYRNLSNQIQRMEDMAKKFQTEILDFDYMDRNLHP
jgi:uncharacterized protein YukE